jgi:hypothetical protein
VSTSPQKAKSLLQIQQEELQHRKEVSARGKPATGPAPAPQQQKQQQRTIKRLDGSTTREAVGPTPPRPQVGSADNESSTMKYSISLAIGGKSATSPVRVTLPGAPPPQHQPAAAAAAAAAKPGLRSSTNGVKSTAVGSSPSRPVAVPGAPGQQATTPPRSAALFPPLGASPQRAPSLADIQREERERVEAERKRREVVKPTKKSLKQIQEEQEEARKMQALFGDELKQIYGHDIDLESIW